MSSRPPVVLVTGANRGTGRGVMESALERGAEVISVGRTPPTGAGVRHLDCDLANDLSVSAAGRSIVQTTRRLDALVVNAARRSFYPVSGARSDDLRTGFQVNFFSAVQLINACLPLLRTSKGVIILVGSHAGTHFFEGGLEYSASKAALKALAEVLMLEERVNGVRTTLVSPGAVSNRAEDASPYKISTDSLAKVLVSLALDQPIDMNIGELEVRPAVLRGEMVTGIARLQEV